MGSLAQSCKLKNHNLSYNDWVMPPEEIQAQGERRMLTVLAHILFISPPIL